MATTKKVPSTHETMKRSRRLIQALRSRVKDLTGQRDEMMLRLCQVEAEKNELLEANKREDVETLAAHIDTLTVISNLSVNISTLESISKRQGIRMGKIINKHKSGGMKDGKNKTDKKASEKR